MPEIITLPFLSLIIIEGNKPLMIAPVDPRSGCAVPAIYLVSFGYSKLKQERGQGCPRSKFTMYPPEMISLNRDTGGYDSVNITLNH